jgi:hypothetical protein
MGISQAAAAADQVEDQHDDSDHDKNVNEPAANMKRKAEQPQNQQNYKNCPEHSSPLSHAGPEWVWPIPGVQHASRATANVVSPKFTEEQPQILRLTTPGLKDVRGPVRSE